MFSFLNDIGNYEDRKVARHTSASGIEVSTAFTSDEGYETALIDANGTHPVERYEYLELAKAGHDRWLAFADTADGEAVTELGGMGGLVPDEVIILKP